MLDSIEPSALSEWLNAMPPDSIFYGVLAFVWVTYLWETYLSSRQHSLMRQTAVMPEAARSIMNEETYAKARAYGMDRSSFGMAHELWSQLLFTAMLSARLIPKLWAVSGQHLAAVWPDSGELSQSVVFLAYSTLIMFVIDQPWSVYKNFVVEARHGFNKQTPAFYVKDQIKGLIVSMVIMLPVTVSLLWLIDRGGPYFYVYAWLLASGITFAMIWIYPSLIAPLFDRYEPMREGRLKERIEELARRLKFPLTKLLVVEGSRRSAHSNAYMYGLWRSKRIVLFDTLIKGYQAAGGDDKKPDSQEQEQVEPAKDEQQNEKSSEKGCDEEEILAVLGHELGHWSLGHNVSNMVISEVNLFLMFFAFGQFVNCHSVFTAFGFAPPAPLLLRLVFVLQFLLSPYNELLSFAMTCLSRRFEFQADYFSVQLGYPEQLKSSLVKLQTDNLSFPVHDWLYSAFNHSHPPLLQRLAAIDEAKVGKKTD